ncbi:MAG: VOC family protein [Actinobacteria bacterium]|nr:VOC family protein [Actinomycetota bacterium]
MKFCWVTIVVNNLEESLKFYREIIGLPINRRFKAKPEIEIAFLGNGETKLELMTSKANRKVKMGQDISIGFEVKSVDKIIVDFKERGIKIHSGPFQPNPNIKFFYVLDPDGLKVQLVESII